MVSGAPTAAAAERLRASVERRRNGSGQTQAISEVHPLAPFPLVTSSVFLAPVR